ncbi:DUF2231 domain-containing protein [Haliangium ochraceum]|uniref:DUF2231 domain-containing protein n=1 Tax=Haliangium ochraceum (strain DSM 14365 / JCM 11303 / SMP-2) TaxID=502025 RepID=D0LTJ9_HALO1|nr:DUF2231 domain-containing protein [Haliangium ochraceum]ACY13894.1 conserved hypothetical protein [Haliangium ochraceum DSM 14365]
MDSLFFHPKVVHLPIALGVLMPLLAGMILLAWWRTWLPARSWVLVIALQAILLASGLMAMQTGESEEDRVERVVPEVAIEEHEEAADVFVWASGGVLGVMLLALALSRSKAGMPIAALATLGTLAVLGLGYRTGQAGGELVYRHNAASVYAGATQGAANQRGELRSRYGGEEHEEDDD